MRAEPRWSWDERSVGVLVTLNRDLAMLLEDGRRFSMVPFQLVEGARSIERQQELFSAGKSKINPAAYADNLPGLYAAARHVVGPGKPLSDAVDVIVHLRGKEYDTAQLAHIAGVLQAVGLIRSTPIRWGGNWDGDSEIITDQSFDDLVHFELSSGA